MIGSIRTDNVAVVVDDLILDGNTTEGISNSRVLHLHQPQQILHQKIHPDSQTGIQLKRHGNETAGTTYTEPYGKRSLPNNSNSTRSQDSLQNDLQNATSNSLYTSNGSHNASEIVVPTPDTLATTNVTIVTAYFKIRSKYDSSLYIPWMRLMLSLQDAMVVYTTPDLVSQILSLRAHALNRTVIIPMMVEQLPVAKMFSTEFWEQQRARDPNRRIHRSIHLYWIWLSKSWFVVDAVSRNYFQSSMYVWSDIGCFRRTLYEGLTLVEHPELIPRHAILTMAHSELIPPKELFLDDKDSPHFFQAGALHAGYSDTWQQFHRFFVETLQGFVQRNLFIGEDQTVFQSTCRQHPTLCAYIHPSTIVGLKVWRKNKRRSTLDDLNPIRWFGLQRVLHFGGNFSLWYHPPLTQDEEGQLNNAIVIPNTSNNTHAASGPNYGFESVTPNTTALAASNDYR